jgi:copper chaperone
VALAKLILSVPDISCSHCERAVKNVLEPQPGIRSVQVDLSAKTVRLDYDERTIDLERIKALLDEEGYPVASAVPA